MAYKIKSNPEAEIGVLGALVAIGNPDNVIVKKAMLQLEADFFYNPNYRALYQFIKKCFATAQWFDVVSILGMNVPKAIFETVTQSIQGNIFTGNLLSHHIEELKKLYELRMQIAILEKTLHDAAIEPTPFLASEIIRSGLHDTSNISLGKLNEGLTFQEIYQEYMAGSFASDTVIRCGIRQFGEIRNCGLITIAGASGVGKTFFSLYFLDSLVRYQPEKQFLFFSLEMKRNAIWERYLSIKLNKSIENITDAERQTHLPSGRVFDHAGIDIDYIETMAHLQAMEKPLSVIVVDYLGIVTTKKRHEREDLKISDITQRLAALAMNLNCTVIALTQVNRDCARRAKDDRCPYPSDVADSVGSVRSASLWIGIDRPENYDNAPDVKNLFVAKCRKTRYGKNFEAFFCFNEGRFQECDKPWTNNNPTNEDRLNALVGAT